MDLNRATTDLRPDVQLAQEEFEITRYVKSDRSRVFGFLQTVFRPAQANRLIAQWDWKYDAYPFNPGLEPYILLLRHGERIIGMIGSMYLRLSLKGTEFLGGSGCDAVIDRAYRGQRLLSKMIDPFMHDLPPGMGWGNAVSNHIWKYPSTENTRLAPLATFSFFNRFGLGGWLGSSKAKGIEIAELENFDGRFDDLWQSVSTDYPVMLVRDLRYLHWRFDERPDANYVRLCAARGDRVLGYLVMRFAERGGRRIGFLVDWMVEGHSFAVFSLLVRRASARARQEGATLMVTYVASPSFRRMLYRMGFFPWFWGRPVYAITQAYWPAENLQIIRRISNWFMTMGDGDLEMGF